MNYISFGNDLGVHLALQQFLDWKCVCYVMDSYTNLVCAKRIAEGHLQDAPVWDSFSTFDGQPWRSVVDLLLGAHHASRTNTESSCSYEDTFLRLVSEIRPSYVLWQITKTDRADVFAAYLADRLEVLDYATTIIESGTDCVGDAANEKSLWVFGKMEITQKFDATSQINRRLRNPCEPKKFTAAPRVCRANERVAHRLERLEAVESGTIPGMVALLASIFGISVVF